MSKMDLTRYRHSLHAHDFTPGGNSRVVMIRKKEQRTFTSNVNGQEPKIETLTKETVQTFRGNKIERKVTSQKKDSQNFNGDITGRISLISLNGSDTPKKSVMGTSVTSMIENEDRGSIRRKPKVSFSDRSFMDKFAQDCLEAHNELRSNHMSPPLRLSKKLSKYSEEWARSLAARGEMQHRAESCYGENIFQVWSSNPDYVISGNEVVHHWYAEMKDHVFGIEPTTLKTGHFTQVVWTESTDLGVGVAKSRTGQIFVVCNYDPPGNFIGSFKDNVPPIGGFADSPRMVTNDKEFQEEALRFHNQYRSKHGAPPLILSNHLSKYAQEWAERMAKEDKMYHRPGNQFGENIYSQYSSSDATARDAVSSWYQEGKNYTKYSAEPRNPLHTGHFTQMVWRGSREFGIGRAKGASGYVYIVANYNPRGNVRGAYAANVLRPVG